MVKTKKVGIIGHFGGRENLQDGQTVKTQILYKELKTATDWKFLCVDTYYKSKNPIKLLWKTFCCAVSCKDVIVLLSGNGMKLYFPLLYLLTKLKKTRVYHDVIGGNLSEYVERYPKFKKYLSSFKVNWVETQKMKTALKEQGVSNAEVLPNFKRLNILPIEDCSEYTQEPFKFCTFSRVMKEKGIEDAALTVERINAEQGRRVCELDIYGKVDPSYVIKFDEFMKGRTDAVKYKGSVPFDKSVEVISEYYALLFPTCWRGEGFAGTIVDAFSAALPVIATDWNANAEIIQNGTNGIIYPSKEHKDLYSAVRWATENADKINEMKPECIKTAKKYRPEKYIKKIVEFIDKI